MHIIDNKLLLTSISLEENKRMMGDIGIFPSFESISNILISEILK